METNDRKVRRCSGCGAWTMVRRNCLICELILVRDCAQETVRSREEKARHREYQEALRHRYELMESLREVPAQGA